MSHELATIEGAIIAVGTIRRIVILPSLASLPPWVFLTSGALVGWLRNFWSLLYSRTIGQVVRRISVSVEVEETEHTQAWMWIQFWAEKKLRERKITDLRLRYVVSQENGGDEIGGKQIQPSNRYELIPAYGTYPFIWKRKYPVVFNSSKDKEQSSDSPNPSSNSLRPKRSVQLRIWGTRNRDLLLELIMEAQSEWEFSHPTILQYFFHRYSYWSSRPMSSRPRSTTYFEEGLLDDALNDCRHFLSSKSKYEAMGIPWRRGFLFYGPPGTGKTTLVQTLATELSLPLYYLNLNALNNREALASLLDDIHSRSIVLIEDVDCIAAAAERLSKAENGNEKPQGSPQTIITPSELLNYIDGIIAVQGRILIMTTNYPEKLDTALVRAGRVDRKWKVDYASQKALIAFHEAAVTNGMTTMSQSSFLGSLPSPATIADAQALLFRGRDLSLSLDSNLSI